MKYVLPILLSLVLSAAGCGEQASSTGAESSEKSASAQSVSPASATVTQNVASPAPKQSSKIVSVTAKAIEAAPGKNPSGKATVTLLEAGAKDNRAPLRYKFKAGHSEPMVMRMKMGMEMDVPGMGVQKMDMPVMVMSMTTKVNSIGADGSAKLSFSIDKAEIEPGGNPMIAAQLQEMLKKFSGVKGGYGITPRGITTDTNVDMTGVTDPQIKKTMEQMRQSMEQASSPLPVEPVGVGARWEVRQLVSADGMKVRQHIVYTLAARNGDVLDLTTTLSQDADKQTISTPEMQGMTAQLESYEAKGSGALKTNLAALVPTGSMQLKNSVVISAQGQRMKMGLDMKVDMGPK